MRLVVTTKFLTRQLVDAVHGVRVRELIFIHYRMRALISKRWHSVRSNRTWEHEFHALTVTARLLCSKLEQVERAAHIHMMCSLWRKFTARRKERRQVEDLANFKLRVDALKQSGVADITNKRVATVTAHARIQLTNVDRHNLSTIARQCVNEPVAHLATSAGD